jgi:dienelactone hydrolase
MSILRRHTETSKKHRQEASTVLAIGILVVMVVVVFVMRFVREEEATQDSTAKMPSLQELVSQFSDQYDLDQSALTNEAPVDTSTERIVHEEMQFIARDSETVKAIYSKPEGDGPFPVMILIHGGESSFRSTEKMASVFEERLIDDEEHPMITLSVDWRESDFAQGDLTDILSAIDWIEKRTEAHNQPILLFGLDHGAYLAVLAAQHASVSGIVSAYGYGNLWEQYQFLKGQNEEQANQFVEQAGCSDTFNTESCLRDASVLTTQIHVPLALLHAPNDSVVPFSQSESLAAEIDSSLITLKRIEDEGTTHDFFSDPNAAGFATAYEAVDEWINSVLTTAESEELDSETETDQSPTINDIEINEVQP